MNSVLGGVALMLVISIVAGVGLQSQFNRSADEVYVSPNGSVRLDR